MSNVNKSKFYHSIEDHIISQKCLSCDTSYDQEEELDICPDEDCGGEDFELTTALEDASCTICDYHFDAYSSEAYQHSENSNLICSSCYDDLVDAENDSDFDDDDDISEEETSNREPVLVEMPDVFKFDSLNHSNSSNNFAPDVTMEMPAIFKSLVAGGESQGTAESIPTMEMPAVFRNMNANSSASQNPSESVEEIEMPDVFKSMVAGGTSQGTAEPIPTMEMPAIFKQMAADSTSSSEEVATHNPLRMIKHRELVGKSIQRVYFAEWNGATVIETTDNCICVMYSSYNHFIGKQEYGELDTVADYRRLILGLQ